MAFTFQETGLAAELMQAVEDLGFENPTPIQEKIIPAILNSTDDLIALAQTGTGKTAAFGLPLIQQTDLSTSKIQTLILCPTRELCMQITGDLKRYARFVNKFEVVAVYGGENIKTQIDALKKRCHAVVGTPGRVLDLIHRKVLDFSQVKWLVLDEADEMLNMGFKEDLDTILAETPAMKRTFLFSATMANEIRHIAKNYMHNPVEISVSKPNISAETVKHEFYVVNAKDRYLALKRVADINPNIYGIVFCRTRQETKEVAEKLIQDGYNADALHGDLSQAQRDHVMNRFRIKNLQILVATDVAARGLDVDNLTHIINYNLPDELESYIHRSGRTGRAGKTGVSISIIHSRQTGKIRDLERMTSKKFVKKPVPGGIEICEKQLFNLVDVVENIEVNDEQIEQFLPVIYKKLSWLTREDLIKHFISVEFNRFLSYYKDAPDLNFMEAHSDRTERGDRKRRGDRDERGDWSERGERGQRERSDRGDRGERGARERGDRGDRGERGPRIVGTQKSERGNKAETGFTRFFINLGNKQSLNAPRLIGLINEQTRKRDIEIGKIEILNNFSFFEVDSNYASKVENSFQGTYFEGTLVNVEQSKPFQTTDFTKKNFSKVKESKKALPRKRKNS
jgi:ATP-dependent RNA helicase DeaD